MIYRIKQSKIQDGSPSYQDLKTDFSHRHKEAQDLRRRVMIVHKSLCLGSNRGSQMENTNAPQAMMVLP